jgi:hypothetical protein
MKLIIITSMLFNLLFVDSKTNEPLTGVRVQTESAIYYSDFDGNVKLPENEKILNVNFISYKPIDKSFNSKDTIINLQSL